MGRPPRAAPRKNGRGRPRKHIHRGTMSMPQLKGSTGLELTTADACAKLYTIGLLLPPEVHEAAREHARDRFLQEKALRREVPKQTMTPPHHFAQHRAWLMSVVSRTCDSQVFKASHPLVLSRTLFRGRELSEECSALLLQWVGLWASRHVTVDFDSTRGMGIRAKKVIHAGTVLVRGTRELDLEENGWDLVGGGSLLGPAALVNSACRNCCNARYEFASVDEPNVWLVVCDRVIHSSEAVLACYRSEGVCSCGNTLHG